MIREIVKEKIKQLVKQADEDTDIDFLFELGNFRKEVVSNFKIITLDDFDNICEEIIEEMG